MAAETKVYTIFATPGYDSARLYHGRSVLGPDGVRRPKNFLSNEDLLKKLQGACEGVEFISRDLRDGYDKLLKEMEDKKNEIDGVLIVGARTRLNRHAMPGTEQDPLAFTGLPTIVVQNLFKLQPSPFELYDKQGNVLTAYLDREAILAPERSQAMFDDLLAKINLMKALRRMKEARILFIANPAANFSLSDYKVFPPRYNDIYRGRLKEAFGTDIITRDIKELVEVYMDMGDEEAKKIARVWIDESEGMADMTEEGVVESAKLYLAMEVFRKECDASAVLVQGLHEECVFTHLSMGMMEFQKHGIIGSYQAQLDAVLAQMLGYYMVGRMSYLHDVIMDVFNNVSIHAHCGCPIRNVWGEKDLPYKIRDYTTGKWHEESLSRDGAVPAVEFPVGVPVTIWKVQAIEKRILVYTGVSVDGNTLYKEFDDILCRNKLILKLDDAEKVQNRWNVREYGCHKTATFGDLRKPIKQLGKLIGFEVVEEDR